MVQSQASKNITTCSLFIYYHQQYYLCYYYCYYCISIDVTLYFFRHRQNM